MRLSKLGAMVIYSCAVFVSELFVSYAVSAVERQYREFLINVVGGIQELQPFIPRLKRVLALTVLGDL